jgi:hypothetical protein
MAEDYLRDFRTSEQNKAPLDILLNALSKECEKRRVCTVLSLAALTFARLQVLLYSASQHDEQWSTLITEIRKVSKITTAFLEAEEVVQPDARWASLILLAMSRILSPIGKEDLETRELSSNLREAMRNKCGYDSWDDRGKELMADLSKLVEA